MVNEEELLSEFSFIGIEKLSPDIIIKCIEIAARFKIDAERLVEEWIAYAQTNLGGNLNPTLINLDAMVRKQFEAKQEKITIKDEPLSPPNKKIKIYNSNTSNDVMNILNIYNTGSPKTPKNERKNRDNLDEIVNFSPASYNPDVTKPSIKYETRPDKGTEIKSFGSKILLEKDIQISGAVSEFVQINFLGNYKAWKTSDGNYMFDSENMEAKMLNNRIEKLGLLFQKKYETNAIDSFFGQIRCEGGRLNAASVLLLTSLEHGKGEIIHLDLQQLTQISTFPGQIVLLKGNLRNSTQKKSLLTQQYFTNIIPDLPDEKPIIKGPEPLKIIVASGPYTLSDNLAYQPLQDLLKYVFENQPHVLILIGPFVDKKHSCVAEMAESFRQHFENLMDRISSSLKDTNIQIVVVPSTLDAHHHNIYPTPPFDPCYKNRFMTDHVHMASDPSLININNLIVGVTSADILFHLAKTEFNFHGQNPDRMGRFAEHVLSQRSFYPVYPPQSSVQNGRRLSIDQQLMSLHGEFDILPHILILPSNLGNFVKNINGCIVINPERLSKGLVGGSFACINIYPGQEKSSIEDNVTCRIIKI